ncbi:TetR/AcrR family transcriptional regulator [Agromyces aerolatus]|uniref:TetR/AcrR family transcriptional regulator n=1 Tax=Agromyces sp. LY-1074 TaxID=3074080 RepID=UPI002859EF09|nr:MULTISPECIES: TetR family transcriptional regulator [unclassified Agromyces]MDR5699602.1 TetR family transcriptional regulator [Agromyces sp. LY-1074]MDR5705898.1 TetR family transcriptional regulator [Agromyces sp. LY-1358]
MVKNAERRRALLEAAVEVLAAQGGRGLTFGAVDTAAAVPAGTASNYFASRDQLIDELAAHVFERLTPDPEESARRMAAEPTRATERDLMMWLVERAQADRAAHLALFELRLEATRNPRLAPAVTRHFAGNLAIANSDHVGGGFPGDRSTVLVLYLAMTGLLLEHLTMPDLLADDAVEAVVNQIVTAVVPE